jgi:hypothetical protein
MSSWLDNKYRLLVGLAVCRLQTSMYFLALVKELLNESMRVNKKLGRALAQAVSRWLPTAVARVQTQL